MIIEPDPAGVLPLAEQRGYPTSKGRALGERLAAPQAAAMLLLVGGFGTYIAFLHPAFGIALLVGISVMTLLHLLLK
ncbi:hypothetical protein OG749_01625 [Streptomyces nojiriensis]|uniref:hypothetical protein n=1 Tax=Streptomyces nojiriensis TaxID=66374 RepID=UPI002E18DD12